MGFDQQSNSTSMDAALGKPSPASAIPWNSGFSTERDQLRKKAQRVYARQDRFTSDELQRLVAMWVLSHE